MGAMKRWASGTAKSDPGAQAAPAPYFSPSSLLRPPILRAAYSDRTSWIMAKMSELAYVRFEDSKMRRAELEAKLASGGFTLIECFNRGGTQAFLATSPTLAVVAFRGTEKNFGDILTDINVRFYHDENKRRTHRGFARAYQHVHDDISRAILGLGMMPVYITGHSLGGALATICAKRNPHDNVAACYTFGSPRVGTGDYDVAIKIPVYRVVNGADLVARIPFATFGYTDVGDLRFISGMGSVLRFVSPWRFGLPFYIYALVTLLRKPLLDHRIGRYIDSLAKFAETRISDERIQGRLGETIPEAVEHTPQTLAAPQTPATSTAPARSLVAWLKRQRLSGSRPTPHG